MPEQATAFGWLQCRAIKLKFSHEASFGETTASAVNSHFKIIQLKIGIGSEATGLNVSARGRPERTGSSHTEQAPKARIVYALRATLISQGPWTPSQPPALVSFKGSIAMPRATSD